MKFIIPFTLVACLFITDLSLAEPVEILSYQSIPSRIHHGNPTLAAARFRINEALGRMTQSGRLSNPTFDTGTEHNLQNAEGRIEIGFSQKFPITNRLALEKEITLAGVEAAEQEVRDVERLLIAEARQEFVRVLSIRERKNLLLKQKDISNQLAQFIASAAEKGETSSLDAARAKLTVLTLTTEERRLHADESATLGKLRPLVGIPPGNGVKLSGTAPPITLPTTREIDRPDLHAARIDLKAAGTSIALEQARRRDDIEASIFAAGERVEDVPDGLENEGLIGFRLSIPLPFWNDNQGNIDAATAIRDRKEKEVATLHGEILHESTTAIAEMRQWRTLISELEDTLLPLAKEQTDLLEKAYLQGQGDLQAVLTSREQTLALQASRLDAICEFQLAHIRYLASVGTP